MGFLLVTLSQRWGEDSVMKSQTVLYEKRRSDMIVSMLLWVYNKKGNSSVVHRQRQALCLLAFTESK